MNEDDKRGSIEPPQAIRGGLEEPTSLEIAIHDMVRREQLQEDLAEKCTYVYAENGRGHIPRANDYKEIDKNRILTIVPEDFEFKNFIEGPLTKLFELVMKPDAVTWKNARATRHQPFLACPIAELSTLGQEIVLCCRHYEPHWGVAYSHHVFSPAITVMLRAMRHCAPTVNRLGKPGKVIVHEQALLNTLDWFVRFVRRVCKSWRFINVLNAHKRQAQETFESAREFIYHCAGRHTKLLILRIDLYYKPYYDVEGADKAAHNFLRWLRSPSCKRNLLPSYLGFLVKRENGLIRGMHFHVMVVCNGNEQRSAGYLTRKLGEHWAKITHQGAGSSHNCYADKNNYKFNGLGLLTLDDWEKMAGLRAALWYMTKADCTIKATNSKTKNFWRSPISKQVRMKLGRPRTNADPLKLLHRMLGGNRSKYPLGIVPKGRKKIGS